MSIPQTFVNNVIDNKQGQDDKDKRVNLKFQAFIGRIVHEKFACWVELLWLQSVRVVSAVLKVHTVETSVDSAVKRFLATASLED